MHSYKIAELNNLFQDILTPGLPEGGWTWLSREISKLDSGDTTSFGAAFVMAPRKTGKARIVAGANQTAELQRIRPGLSIQNWTADRLSRAFLLLHLPAQQQEAYVNTIESLFLSAEMNELVALYGALPLLAYPERWRKRCSEGIRSNIGQVLEALMCDNPFASEQLDEPAWNQLVLKAIFTEKPLLRIVGLRERANASLARSISDFAHERWAAYRPVNPLVWVCVENFVDDRIFGDIQRLAYSTESGEQKAAALLCAGTSYAPAKSYLDKTPQLREIIAEGVTWETVSREAHASPV